jgi:hypothetical protein
VLGLQPKLGRPIQDMPDEFREWIIDFGDSGYVARMNLRLHPAVLLLGQRDGRIPCSFQAPPQHPVPLMPAQGAA